MAKEVKEGRVLLSLRTKTMTICSIDGVSCYETFYFVLISIILSVF